MWWYGGVCLCVCVDMNDFHWEFQAGGRNARWAHSRQQREILTQEGNRHPKLHIVLENVGWVWLKHTISPSMKLCAGLAHSCGILFFGEVFTCQFTSIFLEASYCSDVLLLSLLQLHTALPHQPHTRAYTHALATQSKRHKNSTEKPHYASYFVAATSSSMEICLASAARLKKNIHVWQICMSFSASSNNKMSGFSKGFFSPTSSWGSWFVYPKNSNSS